MSTRRTLWYGDKYHLYQDGFYDENVYLDIKDSRFDSLILKIPLTVWKEMRQHTIQPNERYLDFSETELRVEAEREVDEHRAHLEEVRAKGGKHAGLRMMFGSFVFGSPDTPREEMIEHFIECYRRGRNRTDANAV
jgi:hypothetical protein